MRLRVLSILIITLFGCYVQVARAQNFVAGKGFLLPAIIIGKDTFAYISLDDVVIVSKRTFATYADQYRFNQLRIDIIKVYPYAKKGGALFREIQDSLSKMDSHHDRRKYIRSQEKILDKELSEPLKSLTITQGKLLVKLISRETGENVYDIIKTYKSGTKAFYWNTMGKFLGYDLKVDYDPQEDRDIEIIMRSLEGNTQL